MFAKGLVAGAAGTAALDLYSYGDIVVRGRAPSELPSSVVSKIAARFGRTSFANTDDAVTKHRRSGLGALFGYGVGLGAGVVYAKLRPEFESWLPWPVAGVILAAATLVASEGSATALGATDWRTWSPSDWIADIIPRTLYGLTTAWVVEAFGDPL